MKITRTVSLIDWSSINYFSNPSKSDELYLAAINIELDEDDNDYLDKKLDLQQRLGKHDHYDDRQPIRITGVERTKAEALSWINATLAMISLYADKHGPNTFWKLRDNPRSAKDALDRDPDSFVCPYEYEV